MTKLRAPLKSLIDDSLDEARVQRMWRGMSRAPQRAGWLLAGAVVVGVLVVLGFLRVREPGPLAADGGGNLVLDGGRVSLSDGSRITLANDAQLELIENSGREFGLRLQRGRARFEVTPGGPRRWRIDCGVAQVIVVGTKFAIDRGPAALRVEVEHGVVEVRGARGVQRLTAGQVLTLDETALQPSAALLEEADQARRDGALPRAAALLQKVVRERPNTKEAAIAAFTLARMLMQAQPLEAAAALRASLAAGAPNSLREDVLARLVEAYARAGEGALAAKAAAEYRGSYPTGLHAAEVEAWARRASAR